MGCGHTGTDSPAWSGLIWSGLAVCLGRSWGGSGCVGLVGRVVWTVAWLLPVVPHPVVVWEVVVNTDCGMWSHRDGFPCAVWSGLDSGLVVSLGGTVGWFRLRWAHGSGCLDRGVAPPGRTTPRGRVGGRGKQRLWDVVTPGRIPWRGLVWSGGVWVGRWGGSGCVGLMGRVVSTVGWFLLAVPHPMVVWEVVVNIDCGMWSHRDGLPGVVSSGLVVSGWDGGVVPVAVGSRVGLFGPWGGSSRPYHTPWSCGRSWST